MVAWLCWVYDAITNLAPLRLHAALAHGYGVLHLEHALHLDPELALNHWLAAHHTLGLILSDYYDNAHFVVTLGLLGWLWYRRADIYRPLRNTLVAINGHRLRRLLALPDRSAAAAGGRGLRRRGRIHARARRLAHRGARLGRRPIRGDALAAHGLGGVVLARPVAPGRKRGAPLSGKRGARPVGLQPTAPPLSGKRGARLVGLQPTAPPLSGKRGARLVGLQPTAPPSWRAPLGALRGDRLPVRHLRGGARHRQPLPARRLRGRGDCGARRPAGGGRRSVVALAPGVTNLLRSLRTGRLRRGCCRRSEEGLSKVRRGRTHGLSRL